MVDPNFAADQAASQIVRKLVERGFLPACTVSQSFIQDYVASVVLTAITRSVCAPSDGLGR